MFSSSRCAITQVGYLLEENAFRLYTDRRHMSDLIPFILEEEQARIKNEIACKAVTVIYDGTTRLGEALAIVLRYVGNDWTIQQRLVGLQLLAKSFTGKEIACELVSVLSTTYGIGSDRLLAAMRDGASTKWCSYAYFGSCVSQVYGYNMLFHMIDRVGERFCTPVLDDFITAWIAMFSHSPRAKLCWKHQTGRAMGSYSPTRWWE